jgi:hydroxylamine reductase
LLTLLSLGVKKIAIGPNPPAFLSPGVFQFLKDKFDLRLTSGDPAGDLAAAMGK